MVDVQLSIVIPTFNAGTVLRGCLDSIVCQDGPCFEVLVMDGGSGDDTCEIASEYSKKFSWLRVWGEADSGIYDAMNKGMARARGRWVYFMGADDRMSAADVFLRLAPHFEGDVELLYGDVFNAARSRIIGGEFDLIRLLDETICHQAIFYRRPLLDRVGRFNGRFRICADWDYNLRCFAAGCRAKYVPVTICNYSGAGLSSRSRDSEFLDNKLDLVASYYGVSKWNRLFRSRRYEFLENAQSRFQRGQLAAALHPFALYAFHGVLAKLGA